MQLIRYVLLSFCCFFAACTPKTTEVVTEKPAAVQTTPPPSNLSKCPKFSDAPNPGEAEDNYVIYRDFLKSEMYDKAFELWQKVYEVAPAADGQRATVFEDGIWFYKRIYSGEEDTLRKKELENTILIFYDELADCYGEKEVIGARKAWEEYFTFGAKDKMSIYNQLKEYIDFAGKKSQAFVINPFVSVLRDLYDEGKIPMEEAQKYDALIREIITHNLENAKPADKESWEIVDSWAPERLNEFEIVKGFYDCNYFTDKYYPEYEANSSDCDVMLTTLSRMKYGGCTPENSPQYDQLLNAYTAACRTKVTKNPCYGMLQNAQYREAVTCFEEKMNSSGDNMEKSKYSYLIAKIYYSHLKNFSKARQYAEKAAELRPGWGDPYMMIGRLYASSGPKCGSGRGWNSQVVTWVAIDMWNKAKREDPSVADEANKFIRKYSQYMPDKGDIFQRTLKEGGTYFVPCWIQRSTTIRAAP